MLLWWLAEDPRLPDPVVTAIEHSDNEVLVSAASVWEIEIKRAKGALPAPDDLLELIEASGFEHLPMTAEHASHAGRLPRHHDDPFDRMLAAQAAIENATLVTRDEQLDAYSIAVMDVDSHSCSRPGAE